MITSSCSGVYGCQCKDGKLKAWLTLMIHINRYGQGLSEIKGQYGG